VEMAATKPEWHGMGGCLHELRVAVYMIRRLRQFGLQCAESMHLMHIHVRGVAVTG